MSNLLERYGVIYCLLLLAWGIGATYSLCLYYILMRESYKEKKVAESRIETLLGIMNLRKGQYDFIQQSLFLILGLSPLLDKPLSGYLFIGVLISSQILRTTHALRYSLTKERLRNLIRKDLHHASDLTGTDHQDLN